MLSAEGDPGRCIGADEVPKPPLAIDQRLGAKIAAVSISRSKANSSSRSGALRIANRSALKSMTPAAVWTHISPPMIADRQRNAGDAATTGLYLVVQS